MIEQPIWLRPVVTLAVTLLAAAAIGAAVWWLVDRFGGDRREEGAVEQVSFPTTDGVMITGDLYRPKETRLGAALLLHMMPATRASWREFATKLAERGYLALAIDLRGHGESLMRDGATLNWQNFSDAEHQASRLDVAAALAYLVETKKIPLHQIGIAGASIGANLALDALAGHRQLLWAVLLSPGLDYHGLLTEPAMRVLAPPQRLLLVASDDDAYSLQTVKRLSEVSPTPTAIRRLSAAGHGTTMFEKAPGLMAEVLNWITTNK